MPLTPSPKCNLNNQAPLLDVDINGKHNTTKQQIKTTQQKPNMRVTMNKLALANMHKIN
jgi:hypothetical protein